jgi:hypothetical protein
MVKKDVILNVFSCSTQAPCSNWKNEFFKNAPIIINVPGTGSASFRNKAIQWGHTGDLFRAALNEMVPNSKDIEIGRRGLTTFSAGWNFSEELLKFPAELERLNSYLLLDGCHTTVLDNWIKFAKRAAEGKAFMVMTHSSIIPPFISSTKSNTQIFTAASQGLPTNNDIPDYILHAELPPNGISISAAPAYVDGKLVLPAITKKWTSDPLINSNRCGDLSILGYSGNDRCDHIFIAWYCSKRVWQWLGETWSKAEDEPTIPKVIPEEKPVELIVEPVVKPADTTNQTNVEQIKATQNQSLIQVIILFLLMLFKKLFGTK